MKRILIAITGLLLGVAGAQAQEHSQSTTNAERVLRDACQYLAQAPHFMIKAELWRERVVESGQKLQFTRLLDMEVRRPDRFHADVHSTLSDRGFYYDGAELTVLDRKQNVFSSAPMPQKIDGALDQAHDRLDIDIPLADLATSDPYTSLAGHVQTARRLGTASVLGVNCDHLAFTQDNIDWQIWIETGPRPLIRKMVITHKNEPGEPQFTALITHWDFAERIADSDFVFEPPTGASKIEMRGTSSTGNNHNATISAAESK
jgi:hypothetical protein